MARLSALLVSALLTLGCAPAASDGPDDSWELGDDALDRSDIIDMELGTALAHLSVRAIGVGGSPVPSAAEYRAAIKLIRFQVPANTRVAALMRAETDDLDSYLILRNPALEVLIASDFLISVPGRSSDAMVTIRPAAEDREFVLQASGGEKLTSSGAFTIDLVELPAADPILAVPAGAVYDQHGRLAVDPELNALIEDLGENQRAIAPELAAGNLFETEVGEIQLNTKSPLSQRARLTYLRDQANSLRPRLFDWFVTADSTRDDIARACLRLWSLLAPLAE